MSPATTDEAFVRQEARLVLHALAVVDEEPEIQVRKAVGPAELDQKQAEYKAAVDKWINAIREEERLASQDHSVSEVDLWENAGCEEEKLRNVAKAAKRQYEDALRKNFYHF